MNPSMVLSWNAAVTPKRGPAMTGRIAQLSRGRFCGVIRASDGQDVFFHGRDLEQATYNEAVIGGAVSFELIADRVSGPRAGRVRLTDAAPGKPPASR
jgi:cold shock CspA family protein